jgi:dTDP-4-amino-4,6-dideoxygalactose transaminase
MAVSKAGFNLPSSGNLEVEDLEYIVNAVRKSLGDLI